MPSSIPNPFVEMQRCQRLTPTEAGEFLGFTARSLAVFRCTHRHAIPYFKVGRKVFYQRSDLEAWLASRRMVPGDAK